MKIQIRLIECFDTTIVKGVLEIETEDYKELEGLSKDEALKYIKENSWDLPGDPNDPDDGWSLFDELYDQPTEREKEKNHQTFIEEAL